MKSIARDQDKRNTARYNLAVRTFSCTTNVGKYLYHAAAMFSRARARAIANFHYAKIDIRSFLLRVGSSFHRQLLSRHEVF